MRKFEFDTTNNGIISRTCYNNLIAVDIKCGKTILDSRIKEILYSNSSKNFMGAYQSFGDRINQTELLFLDKYPFFDI